MRDPHFGKGDASTMDSVAFKSLPKHYNRLEAVVAELPLPSCISTLISFVRLKAAERCWEGSSALAGRAQPAVGPASTPGRVPKQTLTLGGVR